MSLFFFQAEDGIRDLTVTGVQTCALPISRNVSAGGVYFVTDQPHTPGALIDFTLVLGALSPSVPCQLRCNGAILRVDPQGDQVGVAATIQSYSIDSASL